MICGGRVAARYESTSNAKGGVVANTNPHQLTNA
jgi:hypothetical protein